MKDIIEAKILDLVNYIVNKPITEVTLDDYTILTNELQEIRNQEFQASNGQRIAELMGIV